MALSRCSRDTWDSEDLTFWSVGNGGLKQVIARGWSNRPLRRVLIALTVFRLAETATWVAVTAFAYDAGGVREASVAMTLQLVPSAGFAFCVGALLDRWGATRVFRLGLLVQAIAFVVVAAGMFAGADGLVVYPPAALAAMAMTTCRPSASVLTTEHVREPVELTVANVLTSWLGAVMSLVGPAIGAGISLAFGYGSTFVLMALLVTVGAMGLRSADVEQELNEEHDGDTSPARLLQGLGQVARAKGPRTMVVCVALGTAIIGAVDLLAVVIAVERLGRDEATSGWLIAAFGLGGALLGPLTVLLIGRRWIAPWIVGSGVCAGGLLAALSAVTSMFAVLALLVAGGAAIALNELTGLMLLQRVTRLDLLGHVFATVEGINMAMLAVGAQLVPLAVAWFGADLASAVIGAFAVAVTLLLAASVVRVDRGARVPIVEMATVRRTAIFAHLPGAALETLAREAELTSFDDGAVVLSQGELGDEFFVIVDGEADVTVDGTFRRTMQRGESFGEIALLHDVTRTATVTARGRTTLLAIGQDAFLTAVSGHPSSRHSALRVADERLAADERSRPT